ncbi:flagellar protein FlaG [Neptuniibacter sp.]|uniref:flagellar protein FlaG n=1 Tax=Neptuniibacter sp. TaxID=1962643 RepID=UPI00261AA14D|nr:flagellar protein FlaG [Neptuniibacter sp.]MCP4595919.1 flagellar protein FlaG [Neptuniibacter sp.]
MADSMSVASTVVTPSSQQPQQGPKVQQAAPQPVPEAPSNERFQKQAQETQEVSMEKLDAAIDRLNEMMQSSQRSLSYSVDKASDKVVVQVRDFTTDQVVRQIPTEEALKFAESLDRMLGMLFDEKA